MATDTNTEESLLCLYTTQPIKPETLLPDIHGLAGEEIYVKICMLTARTIYSRLSLSRTPRDSLKYFEISRTSTYQICRLEEKINRTTAFNKCIYNWTLEVGHMLKILWKRGEIAP